MASCCHPKNLVIIQKLWYLAYSSIFKKTLRMNINTVSTNAQSAPKAIYNSAQLDAYTAAAALTPSKANAAAPTAYEVSGAVDSLNSYAYSQKASVSFHVDSTTGNVVIKVLDANSQQLISQMPTEQALLLAQSLNKAESGNKTGVLLQAQA